MKSNNIKKYLGGLLLDPEDQIIKIKKEDEIVNEKLAKFVQIYEIKTKNGVKEVKQTEYYSLDPKKHVCPYCGADRDVCTIMFECLVCGCC